MVFTTSVRDVASNSSKLPDLEVAVGSAAGVEHRRRGLGCQDSYAYRRGPGALVAVVCDGCGSGRRSEVGAELGARLLVEALSRRLEAGASVADPALWRRVRKDLLAQMRVLVTAMGGSLSETISDCLLFTIVGVAVTPSLSAVFSIGDGLISVNGDTRELGPYADNQPPYLAYDLLDRGGETLFTLQALIATDELEAVIVATDGAVELAGLAKTCLPGGSEPVGELAALAADNRLFRNRDLLRRRLARLSEERYLANWEQGSLEREGGLLSDDTTLFVIRRRPPQREAR